MKRLLASLLCACLAFAVVGCGGAPKSTDTQASADTQASTAPAEPAETTKATEAEASPAAEADKPKGDIVIAGIYKAGDQQWFIGEGAAAAEKAKAMGAKDFMFIDAKMNPDTYLQAVDNAITQGVSGILVCVPDQKLSAVTVQKCKEANIPVIACDDPLMDESGKFVAPFVGIDALKIGTAVGEWSAKYAQDNKMTPEDTGMLLLTMDQVSSCVPRTQGEEEAWKKAFPDWPADKIFRSDYNGETEKGFNAASGIFTANPTIKKWVIMTPNDEGAAGATRALEQAGLDKDSVVCGIGGYLAKLEFAKAEGSAFKATAFINYVDVGSYSAENMMNFLLKGTEIPADFRTPAVIVTKDDYKDIMKDQAN